MEHSATATIIAARSFGIKLKTRTFMVLKDSVNELLRFL
jgi:hypothetical protein